MSASPEAAASSAGEGTFGGRWRERAEQMQEAQMPPGSVTVTCSAPIGAGGLGRHMKEIVDAVQRSPQSRLVATGERGAAPTRAGARGDRVPDPAVLLSRLPIPLSLGVRARASAVAFDVAAARELADAEHLIAFNGQALGQFDAARRAGYSSLALVSANSHLRRVLRQHAKAHRAHPFEGSWAKHLLARNLREYAQAERIYVASDYTRESFLEEGFGEERLARFQFTPDPRYRPSLASPPVETFNIVYVGSLSVAKGTPLLVDAVRRLPQADIRLHLVGGWATRGMRRFLQRACAEDSRISSAPGDPLPHLHAASLYVHPSYEDGFAYAPAEALACGVPVLVSADTGMKELLGGEREGIVVPTGDLDALAGAIEAAYRGEILACARTTAE